MMDDERRRAWIKELEDDWSQFQFEEASRALGPPDPRAARAARTRRESGQSLDEDSAMGPPDPSLPLAKTNPQGRALSPREWAAGVSIWCQAAATWRARALASEAAFERWRWRCWGLAGACILISALWWWSR